MLGSRNIAGPEARNVRKFCGIRELESGKGRDREWGGTQCLEFVGVHPLVSAQELTFIQKNGNSAEVVKRCSRMKCKTLGN